ncbi:MAG TPA: polyphosphate kinase 2 [Thermopetrobacter sp.]|nr:polyphosphate kinase 2 [Thermopetrobacter sp.]
MRPHPRGEDRSTAAMTQNVPDHLWSLDFDALPEDIARLTFPHGPGYAYDAPIPKRAYREQLRRLQLELVKLQKWVRAHNQRLVIIFEGRDAAGKGGTIRRFTRHLNPRHARVVALPKPTERERGEWYFQRYVRHLPSSGEIVFFDRSWYNRAGVERVMGFCSEAQWRSFFEEAPRFEAMLVRDGIRLFKFWLTVSRAEQLKRFYERKTNPLKSWKLSPIDKAAVGRWDDYTRAIADIFRHTHTDMAPWTVIDANDQRRARLEAMRAVLTAIDYADRDAAAIGGADARIVLDGASWRPPVT